VAFSVSWMKTRRKGDVRAKTVFALIRFSVVALAAALHIGCVAPAATVARMDGFNAQWRGFNLLKGDADLYYETEIKVKVVVVGDPAKLGYPGAAGTYSHPEGIIRILGKKINGKIVLCEAVLGHEIHHALQFQDGGFADPDKFEESGH